MIESAAPAAGEPEKRKKGKGKKQAQKPAQKKDKKKKLDLNDPAAVIEAIVASAKKKVADLDVGSAGPPVVYFDTGSYALNWCVSNLAVTGGVPGGRVVEIFGDPSTGKSLIIYKVMACVTQRGGYVILDDTESCYMEPYAAKLGVDVKRVIPLDSDTVEEHFERVLELHTKTRALLGPTVPILIALDSLAMLRTKHEAETEIDKRDLSKASVVRKGMRQLRIAMRRDNYTCYIVANHVIANIGDRYRPRTTPGGKAVPFQCSARIELELRGKVREEKTNRVLGVETYANIVKNKVIEPFRSCRLRIMYRTGLVSGFGLYEVAKTAGVVRPTRSEGWYRMDGVKSKFQAKTFYEKHTQRALELLELQQPMPEPPPVESESDDLDDGDNVDPAENTE